MSESIRTVTVFGANGPTGQLLTRRLLDAGHKVVAATRHPDTFPLTAPCLTVAGADATRPADVALAVRDSDAVVSVLGTKYSRGPITLYSEAARAIVTAMQENGIRRLVVTSSMATVHWRDPNMSWLERFLVEHVLRWIGATLYEDMQRMEDLVSASDLDWTIMRPLGLASMDPPTEYTVARDQISGRQTARADLAAAITEQLDRTDYLHAAVAVATTNKTLNLAKTIWREGIEPNLKSERLR
ncbi:NAD(P)-dependent oxidoreductase [Propionibacterium freudenreichii]|jgi:uncharacterized protein YbjT (DUF2867 family)|uniref:NAD(P)-dependent oxidoreductase n=1 Tax=Propionibacterium freudenreichii TaxID=1744 RepID=UPI000BC31A9A|nr:NAD(P)H-binding protein [Propionibacterium freudenreichii]MDK9347597.1 NAD(P)H-binding protein [Propionibacterium freudenreichii]MDK9642794.1 NAD(P)H-binding protein [Propionibacterium freudenreichii]SBM44402.1 Flavin reductase Short=FR [Propionibacterium freudenreichii]